jgi:hypothetical protein
MTTAVRRPASVLSVLLAALTFAVFVLAASPAQAAGRQMENKERGWFAGPACLEIDYGRSYTGARAAVDWCDQNGLHMQWTAVPTTDGYVQLKVAHTGQCLEVSGGAYTDGTQVVQYPCTANRPQQQWQFIYKSWSNGQYFYEVVARHSGKCLDKSGWNVVQWNCHGGDWQQWSKPA